MSAMTDAKRNRSGPEWYPMGWPNAKAFLEGPEGLEHGTPEGYGYHRRTDKHPCRPCLDSWNFYQKELTKKRKELRARGDIPSAITYKPRKGTMTATKKPNLSAFKLKVYQLALRRLADEHPAEFELLKEEIFEEQEKMIQE